MSGADQKNRNRRYLRKVFIIKRLFLPLLLLIDKIGISGPVEKILNFFIRKAGINKNVHYFFKYRDFAALFKNNFISDDEESGIVLFPMQTSVNGNIPLINLLFSRYLNRNDKLHPVFLVCDSALHICSKDGMLKPRDSHPLFCHECWNGYPHIADKTGIEIKYFSEFIHTNHPALNELESSILKATSTQECENISLGDFPVGRFCRKSVLRYLLKGKFSGTADEIDIYKRFLRSASRYFLILDEYLKSNPRVKYMIIHNGTLAFESAARWHAARRKIPFMTFETFLGQNSLIYKKNGEVMTLDWSDRYNDFLNTFTLDEQAHENARHFFGALKSGVILYSVLNKDHIADRLSGIGPYACLFTNMNFDTAVLDRNGIFESMEDWIYSVVDYWKSNYTGLKLVIRIHPAELKLVTASREFMADRIKNRVGDADNILIIEPGEKVNSYELIKEMEFGLIYASTIGLEIAYSNKTCVVAGIPYFRGKSFLLSPTDKIDYFDTIGRLAKKETEFSIDHDELIRTVNFVYFNRMKKLKGIKVYTPTEEPVTEYSSSDEMINANLKFFSDFRDELFNDEI